MRAPYNPRRAFLRLNRRYFGAGLPADTIVKWSRSPDLMGAAYIQPCMIVLNIGLRRWPKAAELTLLHEMVHLATGDKTHGARFQRAMLTLAKAGAFANLW